MLLDLVKALVVEHSHQRSIGRRAVRIHDAQTPLFLLTRRQTVAEGLPRQAKLLVGRRTTDDLLVLVTLAVLHPSEGDKQAVAVFFLVDELSVNQFCILLHSTFLYDRVAGIDAIDDVEVWVAGANLHGDRFAVAGELAVRHVEPFVCLAGRLRVVQSEDHEGHVNRVLFTDGLEAVLTALK